MKMYFKGGKGILNPVDFDGKEIKKGDILTNDFFYDDFDDEYYKNLYSWSKEEVEKHKHKPFFKVKWSEKGFFYAESIEPCTATISESYYYLHDFRFKYCKIINP